MGPVADDGAGPMSCPTLFERTNPMPMFQKENIDALFGELKRDYDDKDESEQLHRDAHLAIAYHDANRPLPVATDPVVLDLIERHKPAD